MNNTYWNPAGRLACAATLLIPFTVVLSLWQYISSSSSKSMDTMVQTTKLQRFALITHTLYFLYCILVFEVFIDQDPMNTTGVVPESADNLYWQMTCLSGELFFVSSVAMGFMAMQTAVPRWSLLIPIAQVSYNLKNSLIWCGLYSTFSPVGQPIELMKTDAVCIALFTAVYLHHFFTAENAAI